MIDYDLFARAARDATAIAEERGMDAALEHAGLDPKAARRIAYDRAVRMALLATGERELVREGREKVASLTEAQKKLVPMFASLYLDAMATTHLAGREDSQW